MRPIPVVPAEPAPPPEGTHMATDYDSPWKEAADAEYASFLAFYFPAFHELVDWTKQHESLDTELRKLTGQAVVGKKIVDKLVKAVKRFTCSRPTCGTG